MSKEPLAALRCWLCFRVCVFAKKIFGIVGVVNLCVTAYDKDDGTTLLIVVDNAIDMTSQSMAILSTNQMRHRGVDVCDVHHKFTVGDRKGLFRIKVGNHELPLTMYNGLAMLRFRYPSDDELSDDTI